MKLEEVKEIANTVLYEGYLLYPYRQSAIKNRQRWTFGVVYPQEYSLANGEIEPWFMRTECLLIAEPDARLAIHARFLHLLLRNTAEKPEIDRNTPARFPAWQIASNWQPEAWEEGVEREISLPDLQLKDLLAEPVFAKIACPARHLEEEENTEQKLITREQRPLVGAITVAASPAFTKEQKNCYKISVQIENRTPETATINDQRTILLQSFVSTHTILQVEHGRFISLIDPPAELASQAQACHNQRTWPVLVGPGGNTDTLLSSPIILYDYPQIAPESVGALFDGTEIDEILALRIMTLTDEEKAQIRQGDSRARAILERVEGLSAEEFMQLHGTIREQRPVAERAFPTLETPASERLGATRSATALKVGAPTSVTIAGRVIVPGSRVRLHPSARADAFDFLLRDRIARVEVLQQDYEQRLYLVVTLDDDPGREQLDERIMPGHRFFFFPEEVEPLTE